MAKDEDAPSPEFRRHVTELSDTIYSAIHAWAERNGSVVDPGLPLSALHLVLVRTLAQLQPEKRPAYIDEFVRQLRQSMQRHLA